jgi:hypothetical protein
MTVEQLIDKLQAFPLDATACMAVGFGDTTAFEITDVDWLAAGEPAYTRANGLIEHCDRRSIVQVDRDYI